MGKAKERVFEMQRIERRRGAGSRDPERRNQGITHPNPHDPMSARIFAYELEVPRFEQDGWRVVREVFR